MTTIHPRGRGIAILGSPCQMTEAVRKILFFLGHAPLVFHSLEELKDLGIRAEGLAMLIVVGQTRITNWLPRARQIVGPPVPVIASVVSPDDINALASDQCAAGHIFITPPRLADLFVELQNAIKQHRLPERKQTIRKGRFWIYPESNMVGTGHRHFVLAPAMFDFLLGLLFSLDAVQSPAWLTAIAQLHGVSAEQLHADIPALRQRLGLLPARGWRLTANARSGYRLSTVEGVKIPVSPPRSSYAATHVSTEPSTTTKFNDRDFVAFMNHKSTIDAGMPHLR